MLFGAIIFFWGGGAGAAPTDSLSAVVETGWGWSAFCPPDASPKMRTGLGEGGAELEVQGGESESPPRDVWGLGGVLWGRIRPRVPPFLWGGEPALVEINQLLLPRTHLAPCWDGGVLGGFGVPPPGGVETEPELPAQGFIASRRASLVRTDPAPPRAPCPIQTRGCN